MNTFKVDRLHPQGKTDICTEEPTYIAIWYNIVYLSHFFFLSFFLFVWDLKKKLRQTLFCSISPVLFRYFANHPGALRVNVLSRRLMVSQCHCHSHPSTSAPTCPSSPPPPQALSPSGRCHSQYPSNYSPLCSRLLLVHRVFRHYTSAQTNALLFDRVEAMPKTDSTNWKKNKKRFFSISFTTNNKHSINIGCEGSKNNSLLKPVWRFEEVFSFTLKKAQRAVTALHKRLYMLLAA